MSNHGHFSGNPKTEWLVNDKGEDRDMLLLEDFSFTDPAGRVWPAPKGSTVNGASIPQPLWSTIGSPYTDDYRRASVVHDVACDTPTVSRKEADVMFFHACQAGGCSPRRAAVLYAGVRIGAWSAKTRSSKPWFWKTRLFRTLSDTPATEDQLLDAKLSEVLHDLHGLPPEPSIEQLDAIIEPHLAP